MASQALIKNGLIVTFSLLEENQKLSCNPDGHANFSLNCIQFFDRRYGADAATAASFQAVAGLKHPAHTG